MDRFGSTVGKLLCFVQRIELLYFLLYQTVCMAVMVVCKNWPHVFLVINEYNDLWTAEIAGVQVFKKVFKYYLNIRTVFEYLNSI